MVVSILGFSCAAGVDKERVDKAVKPEKYEAKTNVGKTVSRFRELQEKAVGDIINIRGV